MPPGSLLLTVRADPGVGGCEESSTGTLRQEARRRRWPESCADPARQGQSDLTVQDARPHGHVGSAPLSVVAELHLCRPTRCRPRRCPMTWTRRWPPPDSRNSRRGGPPCGSRSWSGSWPPLRGTPPSRVRGQGRGRGRLTLRQNHEGSALRRGLRGPLSRWLLALATRCDRPTAPGADPVTADQPHVTAGEDYTLIGRGPTPTQPVGGVAVTGGCCRCRTSTHPSATAPDRGAFT